MQSFCLVLDVVESRENHQIRIIRRPHPTDTLTSLVLTFTASPCVYHAPRSPPRKCAFLTVPYKSFSLLTILLLNFSSLFLLLVEMVTVNIICPIHIQRLLGFKKAKNICLRKRRVCIVTRILVL